jgi:transcriptional regulator with XRE-family HTH domain
MGNVKPLFKFDPKRLRSAMNHRLLTMHGLAKAAGTTAPSIRMYLAGKINPSFKILRRILEFLEVDFDEAQHSGLIVRDEAQRGGPIVRDEDAG